MYIIELNRDKDYPRFSSEFFRKRWLWRVLRDNDKYSIAEGCSGFKWTAKRSAKTTISVRRDVELSRVRKRHKDEMNNMKKLYKIEKLTVIYEVR